MAAINNCTAILAGPPLGLSPSQVLAAWADLSLYTTAEPCVMCAGAISWAGFREYIYATSIERLVELGWAQITIPSADVVGHGPAAGKTRIVSGVLEAETDRLFAWQFRGGKCPAGCERQRQPLVDGEGEHRQHGCVVQEEEVDVR